MNFLENTPAGRLVVRKVLTPVATWLVNVLSRLNRLLSQRNESRRNRNK